MENLLDKELKFIDKIDCNFPYSSKDDCLQLINEAATLSTNAMFSVIEEICRIPLSEKDKVTNDFLFDLLDETKDKFNHPLKEMIFEAAARMIKGYDFTVDKAISKMQIIKKNKGQFAALSIIYFSCNDEENKLDEAWNDIIFEWQKNGT